MKDILMLLENPVFKSKLVEAINESIDIPIIGESTESKIFTTLLEVFTQVAKHFIQKD